MATLANEQPNDAAHPLSLAEVETLVKRLYLPGSPQDVMKVQNALQGIQRSQQGWQLADALCQSQDEKVRFFGALTFTIKINADWNSLGEDDMTVLRGRLVFLFVNSAMKYESALVTRKLCSALVAYFLQHPMRYSIRYLLCCLLDYRDVGPDDVSRFPATKDILAKFSDEVLIPITWFALNLVDEVAKINLDNAENSNLHEVLETEIDDITCLFLGTVGSDTHRSWKVKQEGTKCLQSWIMYGQKSWPDSVAFVEKLRQLTPAVIESLNREEMFDTAQDMVADVLSNFPVFFTTENLDQLSQYFVDSRAQDLYKQLHSGSADQEPMAFGRLLLEYGEAKLRTFASINTGSPAVPILDMLAGLLTCKGDAVTDDEICVQAIEFWNSYAEYLVTSSSSEKPNSVEGNLAHRYIIETINSCWIKIRIPPNEIAASWDSNTRVAFRTFRADVGDFLQSAYGFVGFTMFRQFVQLALSALDVGRWLELEASLFCLICLCDSMEEEGLGDQALSELFRSSIFSNMTHSIDDIDAKTRQTTVDLIGNYSDFFQRHHEFLPAVLNFLFNVLTIPSLGHAAAGSIDLLCGCCRTELTSEIGSFIQQYEILLYFQDLENGVKEKVIGAIAKIIQANKAEHDQATALSKLLSFVESDIQRCVGLLSQNELESAQVVGVCALRCLVFMGRGLQSPDEQVIDLVAEAPRQNFWEQEDNQAIQRRIIQCTSDVISRFSQDSEVVEAACQILRTGYTETEPGPFVLPYKITEEVITSIGANSVGIGIALETAAVFLRRHTSDSSDRVDETALAFLHHLIRLVSVVGGNAGYDPEVASSAIDLAERFIPRYLITFIDRSVQDFTPGLFMFTLSCLNGPEILPKRSAATFWASFIQVRDQSEQIQHLIETVMLNYGQGLCTTLVQAFGGQAARSDLDALSEPLRKIVVHQKSSKQWLSNALNDTSFPSQFVGPTEKRIWLEKVMSLRGGRGTNQTVKDFWIACRGSNLSYAS